MASPFIILLLLQLICMKEKHQYTNFHWLKNNIVQCEMHWIQT